jgi:hypothetical protein
VAFLEQNKILFKFFLNTYVDVNSEEVGGRLSLAFGINSHFGDTKRLNFAMEIVDFERAYIGQVDLKTAAFFRDKKPTKSLTSKCLSRTNSDRGLIIFKVYSFFCSMT